MNNYKFEIYNDEYVDYTKYATNPVKHADLLDEQLDECTLNLKQCPVEIFEPLTIARITHTNVSEGIFSDTYYERIKARADRGTVFTKEAGRITEALALFYVIANDTAIEVPVGSGKYDHTLYLIELTKILEGFICDSITFTNALGNNYLDGAKDLLFSVRALNPPNSTVGETYSSIHSSYFKNPGANNPAVFPSIVDFVESIASQIPISFFEPENTSPMTLRITNSSDVVVHEEKTELDDNGHLILTITKNGVVTKTEDLGLSVGVPDASKPTYTIPERQLTLADGVYTVYYKFYSTNGYFDTDGLIMSYVSNRYPAKKWTITDVINRCCALVEPQTWKNFPRFRLEGVSYDTSGEALTTYATGRQAEEFEKILSPEFAFTKMTFREQLKQIGGFIHAEPRITALKTDSYGNDYFEIKFDKFGSGVESHLKDRRLISAGFKENINEYCTALDSSADNLVSQIDFAQGVVVEPFEHGFTTLRTESITTRLEENDSTIIPTDKPIFQIKSVVCKYIPGKGTGDWDITPYIFESADYNGTLSSFDGAYPFSKSYALYYTQGNKGIKGLFFKSDDAVSSALQNYSITNILRAVTGDNNLTITKREKGILTTYAEIGFEITYLPIFSARIRTTKQQIRTGLPRTLAYNQSANMIETRYYGAHLKGAAERLGNLEKTYTYVVPFISDIPKAGLLFDKNYYISAVNWEVLPHYIKVTAGLSKDFNRLSEYIGINSEKRMWEVSERMSIDRQTLIQEYVIFSDMPRVKKGIDKYFQTDAESLVGWLFNDSDTVLGLTPISECVVMPDNKAKKSVGTQVILPSTAVSFGNSVLFSVNYADNYSAGQKILGESSADELKGYWGQYVPAADYYGKAYYLTLQWGTGAGGINAEKANALPERGNLTTHTVISISSLRYMKDNRERPMLAYELSAVTDNDELIIGDALMSNTALVNRNPIYKSWTTRGTHLEVWGFTEKLNKFTDIVPSTGTYLGKITVKKATEEDEQEYITLPTVTGTNNYISWALITPFTTETITVEDDNGNVIQQTIQKGGRLVLGRNQKPNGQKIYVSSDTVI